MLISFCYIFLYFLSRHLLYDISLLYSTLLYREMQSINSTRIRFPEYGVFRQLEGDDADEMRSQSSLPSQEQESSADTRK